MEIRYVDDVRPDIKFATSLLTMRMHKPTARVDELADFLLGYLLATKDHKLTFKPTSLQLEFWVDASYNIHPDARSHYGALSCVGPNNASFHAKSGVIKAVCRSSTEAELAANNEILSDALHYSDLMHEFGFKQDTHAVHEDNQAMITLLNAPDLNYQTRSKHIRVRYAFAKQMVQAKRFSYVFVGSADQRADFLTKPLVGEAFRKAASNELNENR
jgi:hypothetical protein